MTGRTLLLGVVAVLAIGTACGGDGDEVSSGGTSTTRNASVSEPPLVGTQWMVIGFVDGKATELLAPPGEAAGSVRFENNGFVTGSDGCNGFGYAMEADTQPSELGLVYQVEGDRIVLTGSPLSTLRGCPGTSYEVYGQGVRAVLQGTVTYEIDGRQLTLQATDGRGVIYTAGE